MKKLNLCEKDNVTYEDILHLTRNRIEIIDDLSMEDENFNLEWSLLKDMENTLWKLTKNQQGFDLAENPKPYKRPDPSEMNPPRSEPMDLFS